MTRSRLVNPWDCLSLTGKIVVYAVLLAVIVFAAGVVYYEARMQGDVSELQITTGALSAQVDGIEAFLEAATGDGFRYLRVHADTPDDTVRVQITVYPDSVAAYEISP